MRHEVRNGAASPVPIPTDVKISAGPALLAHIDDGPGLDAHRERYGPPPRLGLDTLVELTKVVRLRGRGGAGFPFATKLSTAAKGRRPVVVVNMSEGEPASAKDTALALTRPHLILDGALSAAYALGAGELHVVVPDERPRVGEAMRRALAERKDRLTVEMHSAQPRFVAGQARAVLELMAGRPNLPVTSWRPDAVSGHRGRPTLLSNAETWAQVGRLVLVGEAGYRRFGTADEPGTTLLTLSGTTTTPRVIEAEYGARMRDLLPPGLWRPVLVGGFHGSWTTWQTIASARVSVDRMAALGSPLGAGVLLPAGPEECPLDLTTRIVEHLAAQSAGRCGPCFNGLPALAESVRAVRDGAIGTERVKALSAMLVRRGACAHPDGTVRLVRSLLTVFPDEIARHAAHSCDLAVRELAS